MQHIDNQRSSRRGAFIATALIILAAAIIFAIWADSRAGDKAPDGVDYSDKANWAYYGIGEGKDADLFLICPTVDVRDEDHMAMDDEKTRESFVGALNMERGHL